MVNKIEYDCLSGLIDLMISECLIGQDAFYCKLQTELTMFSCDDYLILKFIKG